VRGVTRARTIAALLLVVTAVLLAVGARVERSGHSESHEAAASGEAAEAHESGESGESREAHESGESGESDEATLLGVDPESPAAVATAVVASLLLAAAIWLTGRREVAWAIVAFGLAFAILDVREVGHQLGESRAGLAVLAAAIALGHLGAAGAAAVRPPRVTSRRSPP
jgi:Flp pilus assembly protein TadB